MTQTFDRAPTLQPSRFGPLLGRMVLAGLVAGSLAGIYSLLVTERTIAPALDLEEARDAAAAEDSAHDHAGELFSRGEQLVGGFLGTLLAGVVLAVVFAAVYALLRHRLPGHTDLAKLCLLAGIGFGIFALVRFLQSRAVTPAATATAAVGMLALLLVVVLVLVLLPDNPDPIAADLPASIVWDFRVASLGQLAVLWTTLGLAGGWLVDRLSRSPIDP